jgi:aspartyl/asparaginyl-tRNA synthetase/glutamate mutase epsilon subunit
MTTLETCRWDPDLMARRPSLAQHVAKARAHGALVVQPRMGFSDPRQMRAGLAATRTATPWAAGTVTIDSYTRLGDDDAAVRAVRDGVPLNGYPITAFSPRTTRGMLADSQAHRFPVQVRHGSGRPQRIIAAMVAAGLDATEGGPVSYCLPYGRVPLRESIRNWRESCDLLSGLRSIGREPHLETFGGCLLGQLCPPGLLVAMSVLEGLFFYQAGLRSISLSYAQQTNPDQDDEAIRSLRRLATELLDGADWHVVVYTYMGLYPTTREGALRLLERSAQLAVRAGAARLIVKTEAEAHRIPTVDENVAALRTAARAAARTRTGDDGAAADNAVYAEARALVGAVLNLGTDIGESLATAFVRGYLDVPFCLHHDNAGRSRSYLDDRGRLRWATTGAMPIAPNGDRGPAPRLTATALISALSHVQRSYDRGLPDRRTHRVDSRPSHRGGRAVLTITGGTPRPDAAGPPNPDEHLSSHATRAILRVQAGVLAATRQFLTCRGFVELLAPVIGPVTDPGIRGSKQVDVDFYGHRYKLMTSAILYKQASLLAFDKIFCIAPNVRLEPGETAATHRHLCEFHQIDVELRDGDQEAAMAITEDLVAHVVRSVTADLADDLEELGRDADAFAELLAGPFGRVEHAEAVAELSGLGHPQDRGAEIEWTGEEILSAKSSRPFFITDYPRGSRGFYDREDPDRPGTLRNFDLIAPEGYGELASGSEREHGYAQLVTRIRETGENPGKYRWYLDLARRGLPASSGFGIGVERFTRYITGCAAVWQAAAYPKVPGVVSP